MPRRRQSPVRARIHTQTHGSLVPPTQTSSSRPQIRINPLRSSEPHKIRADSHLEEAGAGARKALTLAAVRATQAPTSGIETRPMASWWCVGDGGGYDEEESERRNASSCRRIDPSAGESTHTRRRGGGARGLGCVMRSSPHRVAQRPRRAFICCASTVDRRLARARPQSFFWSRVRSSSRAARLLLLAAAVGLALTKGHARNRRTAGRASPSLPKNCD